MKMVKICWLCDLFWYLIIEQIPYDIWDKWIGEKIALGKH